MLVLPEQSAVVHRFTCSVCLPQFLRRDTGKVPADFYYFFLTATSIVMAQVIVDLFYKLLLFCFFVVFFVSPLKALSVLSCIACLFVFCCVRL